MYLRELVRTSQVIVNGEIPNIGTRLRANDFIEISLDMSRGTSMQPENLPIDVIHEDTQIILVNKAAGMLVHPTNKDKNGTLLNALAFHLNKSRQVVNGDASPLVRPGLVHRLDRETSGLLLVAKTLSAHRKLARDFMKKRVGKRYIALVDGIVKKQEGMIELPIGRYAEKKLWDVKDDGKHSATSFRVMERFPDTTLIELEPITGRTNQIRIHCASIGHPIVGDAQRGGRKFRRLCLHAWQLTVWHPETRQQMHFETAIPASFEPANY